MFNVVLVEMWPSFIVDTIL